MNLDAFIDKWTPSENSERGNKDLFLSELCDVLGVPRADAATGKPEKDLYVFEKTIPVADEDGKTTLKRVALHKRLCCLREAKQAAAPGSKRTASKARDAIALCCSDDRRNQEHRAERHEPRKYYCHDVPPIGTM